jgi:hypothetical protein
MLFKYNTFSMCAFEEEIHFFFKQTQRYLFFILIAGNSELDSDLYYHK